MAWVTVNFLQGRIAYRSLQHHHTQKQIARHNYDQLSMLAQQTSIVMDLGGASTQLVFAMDPTAGGQQGAGGRYPDDFYYPLQLEVGTLHLYQHSFLGYGLMEARKNIKWTACRAVGSMVNFACFPEGYREATTACTLIGVGRPSWRECTLLVQGIFDKGAPCSSPPCSFNGIHQPAISTRAPIVAFSYLYDRLAPLGLSSPCTLKQIEAAGRSLCDTEHVGHGKYAPLLAENPQWCLDISYAYTLLRHAYGVSEDQEIHLTRDVGGFQAGWCLGAALGLMSEVPSRCPARDEL